MKVNQALILAGGTGSRLGLGTKSHLMYKGKIILEYLLTSCVKAGIENIVVVLVPKSLEKKIEKKKLDRLRFLISKHPKVNFVRGTNLGFRKTPDEVRQNLDEKEPFYIMCGQSPQTISHLTNMAKIYKKNFVVASGYKYRHDYIVSLGSIRKNKVTSFQNIESTKPKNFKASNNELITHFPYIIDFNFYDNLLKKDNFKYRFEFYPYNYLKRGENIYCLENPIGISEIDYKVDVPKLHASIDYLIERNYS